MTEDSVEITVNGQIPASKRLKLTWLKSWQARVAAIVVVGGVVGGSFWAVAAASTTSSLWAASAVPKTISSTTSASIELGTKFKSKVAGQITGIRFYKGAQNTGTHTGSLWDSKGDLLATVTFKGETNKGWQTATFPQPVSIAANVTYVVSYHAPKGHYSFNSQYFAKSAHTNGSLTAPQSTKQNVNGVYKYGNTTTFPNQPSKGDNYWVDVLFTTKLVGASAKPAPPASVQAKQSGSSVVVTWNAASSANPISTYKVLRDGSVLASVNGNTLTYTDSSVTAGKTYSYQVETEDNQNVISDASTTATVTYNVTPPPVCPAGDTGTPPNCVAPVTGGGSGGGSTSYYQPAEDTNWMWEIGSPLITSNAKLMGTGVTAYNGDTAPSDNPTLYDVDGIENSAATVSALHAAGDHAVCYIEVGTAGNYSGYTASQEGISTTYYDQLSAAGDLSTTKLSGYPEKYININASSAVSIIESMINQQCAKKGFDAVETDLDETFGGNEGKTTPFTITEADEVTYLTTLANYMHGLGLGWIAKNLDDTDNAAFVNAMEPLAQGAITEQCNQYDSCSLLNGFLKDKKWIGNAEYSLTQAKFCAADNAADINGILFNVNLDGGREPCR